MVLKQVIWLLMMKYKNNVTLLMKENYVMKKVLQLSALLLFTLLLAGCAPAADQDNTDDFLRVNTYVEEILPVIGDIMLDLTGWVRDPLDEERITWLGEGKEKLHSIQKKHLNNRFPSYEKMESWTVPVVRGDEKWDIEGEILAPVVKRFVEAVDLLDDSLTMIVDAGGKMGKGGVEEVRKVMQEVNEAAYEIKAIFGMG